VVGFCECGNEPSGSIIGVEFFFEKLRTRHFLKKDSTAWSKLDNSKDVARSSREII